MQATHLSDLFQAIFGRAPEVIVPLPAHASTRAMYRLSSGDCCVIGVYNSNIKQNETFLGFSKHFSEYGLPVPEVYGASKDKECYLVQDLGETTLLDCVTSEGASQFSPEVLKLYESAVRWLTKFQVQAGATLDYSLCHQREEYDRGNMLWDMHFFRDSFVRQYGVPFDIRKLNSEFERFSDFLDQADRKFFMYRDFQARNIMVQHGKLYFIDYQEGRRGPLQYDVVSLLYQSKANLPPEVRKRVLNVYLEALSEVHDFDREQFLALYHGFVFIRIMQVLGTYGEQGLRQKKEYFRDSIPFALRNLGALLDTVSFPIEAPEMLRLFKDLASRASEQKREANDQTIQVNLYSFSYRLGMPPIGGDHGGGFVFDCRCIPNPGREERYKQLTGLDDPVRDYLDNKPETHKFLSHILALIDQAIDSYKERGFTSLAIGLGCTGGQHRSVYFAERIARVLRARSGIQLELRHHSLEAMGRITFKA